MYSADMAHLADDDFLTVVFQSHGEVPPGPGLVVILRHWQEETEIMDVCDVLLLITLK